MENKKTRGRKPLTKDQVQMRLDVMQHLIDSFNSFEAPTPADTDEVEAIKKQVYGINDRLEAKLASIEEKERENS